MKLIEIEYFTKKRWRQFARFMTKHRGGDRSLDEFIDDIFEEVASERDEREMRERLRIKG